MKHNINARRKYLVKPIKYQLGIALENLMLALIIASILGLIAMSIFKANKSDANADNEVSFINAIISKAPNRYASDPDFSKVTIAGLIAANVFPERNVKGTTVVNNYNGLVTFAPVNTTTPSDSLEITSNNYPKSACQAVVTGLKKSESMITAIKVNGTDIKQANTTISLDPLGTACNDASTIVIVVPH